MSQGSPSAALVTRIEGADPGWPEWAQLLARVRRAEWHLQEEDYLGAFFVSEDTRLCFSAPPPDFAWPAWLPRYVPALAGLKADDCEMAGGYADCFDGTPTQEGSVFAPGALDADLGFPLIAVPLGTYAFQSNSSGALFHISSDLRIWYPDGDRGRFAVLDTLEAFTRKVLVQVLAGHEWFEAYHDLDAELLD